MVGLGNMAVFPQLDTPSLPSPGAAGFFSVDRHNACSSPELGGLVRDGDGRRVVRTIYLGDRFPVRATAESPGPGRVKGPGYSIEMPIARLARTQGLNTQAAGRHGTKGRQ